GAKSLKEVDVPEDLVQMVPSHEIGRDRTYSSAIALRQWFQDSHLEIHSMNILTEDVHGRRTRLLFQKAFGDRMAIGVISVPNPDYDAKHWWRYSEGVKDVISEGAAYVY